jgi:hypothetical protein
MRYLAAIVPCLIPTNLLNTINQPSIVHSSHKKTVLETVFNVFVHGAGCGSKSDSVQMLFGKSRFTCPRARAGEKGYMGVFRGARINFQGLGGGGTLSRSPYWTTACTRP